jgi:hypothetical protein
MLGPIGNAPRHAVGRYRVSTAEQGQSGLGLEAQRASVRAFCAAQGWALVAEYSGIASARWDCPGSVDTDDAFARGVLPCPRRVRPTRRSSGARWSSWSEPDVIRPIWLASSSPPPRRSGTGFLWPTDRKAAARRNLPMPMLPLRLPSARSWRGCGVPVPPAWCRGAGARPARRAAGRPYSGGSRRRRSPARSGRSPWPCRCAAASARRTGGAW